MKKRFYLLIVLALIVTITANAKIWRVNNNAGVAADFTTFNGAATSASVLAGDTLHLEPSATDYGTGGFTLTKRLVVIGPGYFLDPANTTTPGNTGLQAATQPATLSFLRIANGSNGSKFIGVSFNSAVFFNASASPLNLIFEKCRLVSGATIFFETAGTYDGISFRKCFFQAGVTSAAGISIMNFVSENCIFQSSGYIQLNNLSGSGNIYRNNSQINNNNTFTLLNCYVANNIFSTTSASTFTNCVIKNNLFAATAATQNLPPTATNNLLNVNMNDVYVGGTTGSLDSRTVLKAGSPAIGAGVTVGTVISPDCGAYGATDPYKLSGIPNIPSIYTLTVPLSIPTGTNSMNITLSTRNNN